MGDGRTLAQAIRALDKFVAELNRDRIRTPCDRLRDTDCPVRRAYERIVSGAAGGTLPPR